MDENISFPVSGPRARMSWRMGAVQTIMDATGLLVARSQMTQREHERIVEQAWNAQLELDDETLRQLLRSYSPSSDPSARFPEP